MDRLATKYLFLDLEETIITPIENGWQAVDLINVEKIKRIIAEFKPDVVSIFSFAIWNDHELGQFDKYLREILETELNVKFVEVYVVDTDIIPMACAVRRMAASTVDLSEVCAFWGKHEAFRLVVRSQFGDAWENFDAITEVMLVDDTVLNETWDWPDLKISGKIVNIKSIGD